MEQSAASEPGKSWLMETLEGIQHSQETILGTGDGYVLDIHKFVHADGQEDSYAGTILLPIGHPFESHLKAGVSLELDGIQMDGMSSLHVGAEIVIGHGLGTPNEVRHLLHKWLNYLRFPRKSAWKLSRQMRDKDDVWHWISCTLEDMNDGQ